MRFLIAFLMICSAAIGAERREWYLVSEDWCSHCPRAKKVFLDKGWPAENILTIAECERRFRFRPGHVPFEFGDPFWKKQEVTQDTVLTRPRFVSTQWGNIDLETYSRPGCNCVMCRSVRSLQSQYWASGQIVVTSSLVQPAQEPTPADVAERLLDAIELQSSDVYCDLGCGDGRLLIAAVERSGCTAIGIEIDPIMAGRARQRVANAGLSGRISVITMDACDFLPSDYGVTKITAYLYPETLKKLAWKMAQAKISASPFHPVDGLSGQRVGDIWIYKATM